MVCGREAAQASKGETQVRGDHAHRTSLRFLKFSVKVVRHKDGLYFVASLWKKTSW